MMRSVVAVGSLFFLLLVPGLAAGKCPLQVERSYPRPQQKDVPLDAHLFLVLNAEHSVLSSGKLTRLPSLQAGRTPAIRLTLLEAVRQTTSPTLVFLHLRPQRRLKPLTEYRLSWPANPKFWGKIVTLSFTSGRSQRGPTTVQAKLLRPVFRHNKPKCGHELSFDLTIEGADPTGIHHLQLAPDRGAFAAPRKKGTTPQHVEIWDIQPPGHAQLGSRGCESIYAIEPGKRVWLRLRLVAPQGASGPWSEPVLLEANPRGPHAESTCPPFL